MSYTIITPGGLFGLLLLLFACCCITRKRRFVCFVTKVTEIGAPEKTCEVFDQVIVIIMKIEIKCVGIWLCMCVERLHAFTPCRNVMEDHNFDI